MVQFESGFAKDLFKIYLQSFVATFSFKSPYARRREFIAKHPLSASKKGPLLWITFRLDRASVATSECRGILQTASEGGRMLL